MQKHKHSKGLRILIYYVMILLLLSLVVVTTYTWFTINQSLKVNDLNLYVNSQDGLQIAQTIDGEWGASLEFDKLVEEKTPLRPVSWSDRENRFYAAYYGLDGRLMDFWQPLSDDNNSNRSDVHGYYIKGTIYMRTDTNMDVSLAPPVATESGMSGTFAVGKPMWDANSIGHYNGGYKAETAIRIGLRMTPVNKDGTDAGEHRFIIIEPNADTHMDGSTGYIPTTNIHGDGELVSQDNLFLQNTATWKEADPVLRDHLVWTAGDFTGETKLFHLKKGELMRLEIYIWLEGQDVDCNNRIGTQAEILANLQFAGTPGGNSGLVPIE